MVIGNAKKAGVKQFIVPGVDEYSSQKAIGLALSQPGIIFASIGFHPYEAGHAPSLSFLESRLNQPPTLNHQSPIIIAIGECGLDYHLYKDQEAAGKKSAQKFLFSEQLHLALKYNLPVIMHCRDAFSDFFDVLDDLPSLPRAVIHCFAGGLQEVRLAQNRHLLLGVDGNLTYSKQLQLILPQIPLKMILLETDAPYLTPAPHRGQRNESKYIPLIAQKLARLHQVAVSQIEKQTTDNAKSLFNIQG